MSNGPKICLIDVVDPKNTSHEPPLALVMLASYLIQHNILPISNIKIIDNVDSDPELVIALFRPDIIGFSVKTPFYHIATSLAKKLRRISSACFIIGGYHISALPTYLDKNFDIGVIGEGEKTLSEVVEILKSDSSLSVQKLSSVDSIVFRDDDGELIITKRRPLLFPDEIPYINWDLLPKDRIFYYRPIIKDDRAETMRIGYIFTARGCPYHCSFCAHQVLWPQYRGFRLYSVERVGQEIEFLYRTFGINTIQILDDTFSFAVSISRIRELIKELKKRNLFNKVFFYNIFIRANIVNEELVGLLKELGTLSVFIGIESGSQRILSYLKDGPLTIADIKRAILLFGKAGIYVTGSFMLFSPNEERKDIMKTYELTKWFAKQPNSLTLRHYVTTPYPGTKLWNEAIQKGLIFEDKVNWKDFVMYNARSNKLPRVFFKNVSSVRDYDKIWKKFSDIKLSMETKLKNKKNWKNAEHKALLENNKLLALYYRKIAKDNILGRISRLYHNPKVTLRKVKKRPILILKYIMKDVIKIVGINEDSSR